MEAWNFMVEQLGSGSVTGPGFDKIPSQKGSKKVALPGSDNKKAANITDKPTPRAGKVHSTHGEVRSQAGVSAGIDLKGKDIDNLTREPKDIALRTRSVSQEVGIAGAAYTEEPELPPPPEGFEDLLAPPEYPHHLDAEEAPPKHDFDADEIPPPPDEMPDDFMLPEAPSAPGRPSSASVSLRRDEEATIERFDPREDRGKLERDSEGFNFDKDYQEASPQLRAKLDELTKLNGFMQLSKDKTKLKNNLLESNPNAVLKMFEKSPERVTRILSKLLVQTKYSTGATRDNAIKEVKTILAKFEGNKASQLYRDQGIGSMLAEFTAKQLPNARVSNAPLPQAQPARPTVAANQPPVEEPKFTLSRPVSPALQEIDKLIGESENPMTDNRSKLLALSEASKKLQNLKGLGADTRRGAVERKIIELFKTSNPALRAQVIMQFESNPERLLSLVKTMSLEQQQELARSAYKDEPSALRYMVKTPAVKDVAITLLDGFPEQVKGMMGGALLSLASQAQNQAVIDKIQEMRR